MSFADNAADVCVLCKDAGRWNNTDLVYCEQSGWTVCRTDHDANCAPDCIARVAAQGAGT